MRVLKSALWLLLLTGCSDFSDGPGSFDRAVTGILSGGGGSRAVPQQAPAQQLPGTAGVMAIEQVQRGAVTAADCQRHLSRLGPGWRLAEVRPNDLGVGGVLRVICILERTNPDAASGDITDPNNR